jgi:hypothetical protein
MYGSEKKVVRCRFEDRGRASPRHCDDKGRVRPPVLPRLRVPPSAVVSKFSKANLDVGIHPRLRPVPVCIPAKADARQEKKKQEPFAMKKRSSLRCVSFERWVCCFVHSEVWQVADSNPLQFSSLSARSFRAEPSCNKSVPLPDQRKKNQRPPPRARGIAKTRKSKTGNQESRGDTPDFAAWR